MEEKIRNYDIFKGISQKDRFKKELRPDFVRIDGRSLPDMLEFIRIYAKEINFIHSNESINDVEELLNWNDFFNRDNLILLIAMSNFDVIGVEEEAEEYLETASHPISVEDSSDEESPDQGASYQDLNALVNLILNIAQELSYFRTHLQRDEINKDLIFDIGNAINEKLGRYISHLYNYKNILQWDETTEDRFLKILKDWKRDTSEPEKADADSPKDISRIIAQLRGIFNAFHQTIYYIVEKSNILYKDLMSDMKNSKPHVALYISFLKIFKYVQDIQNQIPQKHLDFYYQEILKQKEQKVRPDQALIHLKLSSDISAYHLKQGTLLSAGKNSNDEDLLYKTVQPLSLTSSKIMKICSLFKTHDKRYHQRPNLGFVTDIFSHHTSRPVKGDFVLNNFSPFGEEQVLKNENERTMDESRFGFLFSSPILKLGSGNRKVELELEFEADGFKKVHSILEEVSEQNNESIESTIYKVFSSAFNLSVSQAETMKSITNYGFDFNTDASTWTFDFELGMDDEAFESLNTQRPLYPSFQDPFIEIQLKHECSLFLYSILIELILKNIKIRTKTENLKDPLLYNTYGRISPNSPFELFGLIPKNNSFFVVGHHEVFSKEIDSLQLKLQWFTLPIVNGGMEDYFKEYINEDLIPKTLQPIETSDYKFQTSLLKNRQWIKSPSDLKGLQLFHNKKNKETILADQYQEELVIDLDMAKMGYITGELPENYDFDQNSTRGFLKFTLNCPELCFG